MNYQIGALGAEAQTADFACGEPVLDQYLQRYARQDIKRGVARVFVATAEPQPAEVLGFYTLSAASIAAARGALLVHRSPPSGDDDAQIAHEGPVLRIAG